MPGKRNNKIGLLFSDVSYQLNPNDCGLYDKPMLWPMLLGLIPQNKDTYRDVEIFLWHASHFNWFLSVRTIKYAAEILIFCQSEWNFVSQILRFDTFRHHCTYRSKWVHISFRAASQMVLYRLHEVCPSDGQIRQKFDRSDKTYVFLGLNVRHCPGPNIPICWQRALCYAPLFPSAIGPISRFLKNHQEGIIKHIIINHTLCYDYITLNLFHIWLICENSANNRVVIIRIICCGWRRNLV